MPIESPPMAKKKRDPDKWERKPVVLIMRGSPEFKAWLERFAESQGMTLTALVDRAVRKYASIEGFESAPMR
jgi:hypothetical protein